MEFENNAYFWQKIDLLYLSNDLKINHPKCSRHPKYSNLIYPVDYGYLDVACDAEKGIEIFKGSKGNNNIQAMVICADILKKDLEVKLLADCTEEEELAVLTFLNQTDFQKSVLIRRGMNIPDWAMSI